MSETHSRTAVFVLCAAGIVVSLMQTIIVPLIPALPQLIHTSASNSSWALTVTMLVGAVATPIAGRVGDMIGKRLVMIVNMVAVAAGSVVCALSTALAPFLIGRALQGVGIGTIAVGISIIRDIVPAHRLGPSVGAMSASLGVGGALGLPFAAVVAEQISWHALFWISAATALASGLAVRAYIPESSTRSGGRFDTVGALGLTASLTSFLLPVSKGAEWGWTAPPTVGLFIVFLVVTALWWRWERRAAEPLIDLTVLTRRPVMLTNIASVATGFAFYASQMAPIQLLMAPTSTPGGVGMSMVAASLVLMPLGLVMFGFSYVSSWLTERRGARVSLATGGAIIGVAYLVFILALEGPWHVGRLSMLLMGCLVGMGLGLAYSSMPALIMAATPVGQTGEANGVNSLMRAVGTAMSTAVVGMVLTASTVSTRTPQGSISTPSIGAYTVTGVICIAMTVIAVVAALSIPRDRPRRIDDVAV
nr:MFS transporter [Gordonia humi]